MFRYETDFENLVWLLPDRIVRRVVYPVLRDVVLKYLVAAPGLWGCCPTEDYETMKALLLDPVANAAVIEKSDAIHAGVMSHIAETLNRARAAGVNVAILAGAGTQQMSGNRVDGDTTVDTVHATGGVSAKLGCTLPEDPESLHRSPYGTLDVTDGYLPDNTWVVQGMTHGQSAWDTETRSNGTAISRRGERIHLCTRFAAKGNKNRPGDRLLHRKRRRQTAEIPHRLLRGDLNTIESCSTPVKYAGVSLCPSLSHYSSVYCRQSISQTVPVNSGRPSSPVMTKAKGRSSTKSISSSGGMAAPAPMIAVNEAAVTPSSSIATLAPWRI